MPGNSTQYRTALPPRAELGCAVTAHLTGLFLPAQHLLLVGKRGPEQFFFYPAAGTITELALQRLARIKPGGPSTPALCIFGQFKS